MHDLATSSGLSFLNEKRTVAAGAARGGGFEQELEHVAIRCEIASDGVCAGSSCVFLVSRAAPATRSARCSTGDYAGDELGIGVNRLFDPIGAFGSFFRDTK